MLDAEDDAIFKSFNIVQNAKFMKSFNNAK